MKRVFLVLIALATSWWGYRKLRSHPLTTRTLCELEGQSQRIVDQASAALRSAKAPRGDGSATMADARARVAQAENAAAAAVGAGPPQTAN